MKNYEEKKNEKREISLEDCLKAVSDTITDLKDLVEANPMLILAFTVFGTKLSNRLFPEDDQEEQTSES